MLLLFTSFGTFAVVLLTAVVAGSVTSGYSHVSQFISELGATGAPYEWPVRLAGFLPAGLFLLTFCALAYRALPPSRGVSLGLAWLALYAAGYLVAAAFPCDLGCRPATPSLSQVVHSAGGLVGYVLAPGFLFALASSARGWPNAGLVVLAGYVAAALALAGLLTLSPSSPAVGVSQRVLEGAVLGWVVVCGTWLARHRPRLA